MPALFFFNDTATTEIYTLSLHDALPICPPPAGGRPGPSRSAPAPPPTTRRAPRPPDRKSTRLNSSHLGISYAVFCLQKKKTILSIFVPMVDAFNVRVLDVRITTCDF